MLLSGGPTQYRDIQSALPFILYTLSILTFPRRIVSFLQATKSTWNIFIMGHVPRQEDELQIDMQLFKLGSSGYFHIMVYLINNKQGRFCLQPGLSLDTLGRFIAVHRGLEWKDLERAYRLQRTRNATTFMYLGSLNFRII